MSKKYQVTRNQELVVNLRKRILGAKDQVELATMALLNDDNNMEFFSNELMELSKKGVRTELIYDQWFSVFLNFFEGKISSFTEKINRLKSSGVTLRGVGVFALNVLVKRFHIKYYIVDDEIAIGTKNLITNDTEEVAVWFKDVEFIVWLQNYMKNDLSKNIDTRYDFLDGDYVLIDSGKASESIIYDEVLEYTKKSQKVYIASQYPPLGRLAKVLSEINSDNVENVCKYNSKLELFCFEFLRIFYYRSPKIKSKCSKNHLLKSHAKLMVFELENEKEIAVIGSHNYSELGVDFGTKEIALFSKNPELISEIKKIILEIKNC